MRSVLLTAVSFFTVAFCTQALLLTPPQPCNNVSDESLIPSSLRTSTHFFPALPFGNQFLQVNFSFCSPEKFQYNDTTTRSTGAAVGFMLAGVVSSSSLLMNSELQCDDGDSSSVGLCWVFYNITNVSIAVREKGSLSFDAIDRVGSRSGGLREVVVAMFGTSLGGVHGSAGVATATITIRCLAGLPNGTLSTDPMHHAGLVGNSSLDLYFVSNDVCAEEPATQAPMWEPSIEVSKGAIAFAGLLYVVDGLLLVGAVWRWRVQAVRAKGSSQYKLLF